MALFGTYWRQAVTCLHLEPLNASPDGQAIPICCKVLSAALETSLISTFQVIQEDVSEPGKMPTVVSSTPAGLLCIQNIPWTPASGPAPCDRDSSFPVIQQSRPSRLPVLACSCLKHNHTEIKAIFVIFGELSTPGQSSFPEATDGSCHGSMWSITSLDSGNTKNWSYNNFASCSGCQGLLPATTEKWL